MTLFPNREGVDTLYAVVKGTFRLAGELDGSLEIAETQVPPVQTDTHWGEPGASSLRYASEMHLEKPGTDVALVGQAWAPDGRATKGVHVVLEVAGRRKTARVLGDRRWKSGLLGGRISDPEPFTSIPLVWERAFGGTHVDEKKDRVHAEQRNPVGVGFKGKRRFDDVVGTLLPNIEDPERPFKGWGDNPPPFGFGFVPPSWLPRRNYAGTYDEDWQARRAPYLPLDFDPRFFHAVPVDQVFEQPLQGGEPVRLEGCSPRGPLEFQLPRVTPEVQVKLGSAVTDLAMTLETVLIEPDEDRLCLSWRGAFPCDKRALKIEEVRITTPSLQAMGGAA